MVMPGLGLMGNSCPSQIEALVFMKMKQAVEKYLGHTVKKMPWSCLIQWVRATAAKNAG